MFSAAIVMAQNPTLKVDGVDLDRVPVSLTFDGDNVIVCFSDGTDNSYDMSGVTIEYNINALDAVNAFVFRGNVGDCLDVSGALDSYPLEVFDSAGRKMVSVLVVDGNAKIKTSDFGAGVYFMRNAGNIVKFVQR